MSIKFISLCVTVFLMSCNNVAKPVNEIIKPSNDIVGSWSMCSYITNGSMIQMNVCPEIMMLSNGKGSISMNGIIKENFQWSLEKVQMKIFYPKTVSEPTFSDSSYFVTLKKDSNTMKLTLTHNNTVLYLNKYSKP